MTPEDLQTFLEALQLFLGQDFVAQLRDILSFGLGAASGLSFSFAVLTAAQVTR